MFHSIRRSTRAAALVVVAALVAPVAVALAPTAAGAAPVTAPFSYVGAPVAIPDGLDLTGTQPGAEATVDVTAGALAQPDHRHRPPHRRLRVHCEPRGDDRWHRPTPS